MVNNLDHVVITTNDADGFIEVYRDVFNLRLALDKFVDEWKSRMLFFRFNKTTIEVLEKKMMKNQKIHYGDYHGRLMTLKKLILDLKKSE